MKCSFLLSLIFLLSSCASLPPKPSNVDGVQKVSVNQFISFDAKQ